MRKAIEIGCTGSEKTTFAHSLSKITAVPLYHPDSIRQKAGRYLKNVEAKNYNKD